MTSRQIIDEIRRALKGYKFHYDTLRDGLIEEYGYDCFRALQYKAFEIELRKADYNG